MSHDRSAQSSQLPSFAAVSAFASVMWLVLIVAICLVIIGSNLLGMPIVKAEAPAECSPPAGTLQLQRTHVDARWRLDQPPLDPPTTLILRLALPSETQVCIEALNPGTQSTHTQCASLGAFRGE